MLLDGYFTVKCLKTLLVKSVHTVNVSVFKHLAVKEPSNQRNLSICQCSVLDIFPY